MTRALRTAVFGVLLCMVAGAFHLTALYVPGVALIFVGLGAILWVVLAAQGATLVREAAPATVQEDEPYPLRLRSRSGVLPVPAGELIEPLLGYPLPATDPRSKRVRVNVRFSRRGRRHLEPARLVIRDPLSLARREVLSDRSELLVLPRIEPVMLGQAAGAAGMETVSGALTEAAAELELHSLRPYRIGSPASRIHWPTVARTGEMVERRLVAEADARPLVVLDPRDPPTPEALDSAVRAAGSIAVHLARRGGGCSLLLPGDRRAASLQHDLRGWPALHARLALLQPSDGGPNARQLERSGPVFWVSGGGGGLPPAVKRGAGSYFVTPIAIEGRAATFAVAGCMGYRLSGLRKRAAA
jgi:uncharacterized protein (DUF58 family)